MNTNAERLHYMDNLRALVMIAGVFFHASLAYSPFLHSVWFTADTVNSRALEVFFNFTHVWRMPLFFVVSGFFTALLVRRRGMGAMFKNRLLRVLLPLVIFWPLVAAAIIIPIGWAIEQVDNKSPILLLIAQMQHTPDAPKPPPTLAHLWFLYYLMVFYVLTWVFSQLPFSRLSGAIISMHPVKAIVVLPLLLLPGLSLGMVPYTAPDSFMLQAWALLFFGMFFACGYILYASSRLLDYFERWWYLLLVISIVIYVPMAYLYPEVVSLDLKNPEWKIRLPLILCTAYISTFMAIVGIIAAKKLLNRRSVYMRYMADASYWIYLVHLPIVLIIQYWLLDQNGGVVYKFCISSFGTLIICFLSYILFVRWTPIAYLLNGRRRGILSTE